MDWKSKVAALVIVGMSPVANGGAIPEVVSLLVILIAAIVIWRQMEGFWRTLFAGLAGGAIAGLLILGPGFRLAMRAVALMDPVHPEEFSVGGTLLIVVGIGAIIGGLSALTFHLLRRVFGIQSPIVAGSLLAASEMFTLVFLTGDLSREFFELGISPWINIPLFGVITLAYGIAAMAVADLVEGAVSPSRRIERAKVPA